jgi:uncharacterized protein YgbK (DUF1537 family)
MNDVSQALRASVLFYGDDFTGASDNAAQYARHGLKTVLFFSDPGADVLTQAARDYDVVGVAGTARSLNPDGMRTELLPVLCSTSAVLPLTRRLKQAASAMPYI